ncbi:AfsR/SARP family transcriptional regulator [Micromonospora sp. NPDC049559]|uniref:AfsR/SARP family transcriptional regulator n=1 Tax=Micromonospora sp. NPDC049559 TaxID=3155923 RepID=UPI0034385F70
MRIEIRLLGAVEVRVDGRPAVLGPAKRQAVLAGLALEHERQVSLERLASMVWAGQPPRSMVANLRTHAAALRQVLGDRVVAGPGAYRLRIGAGELDADEFTALAGAGRAALAKDDPSSAASSLTAALALWRGAVAGERLRCGPVLEAHLAALQEQRRQVFEDLAEARLALGEHANLVRPLRQYLADHPLRERAWAQLMLALYRGGDVAGALDAYRSARTVLDEQLGLEPGTELAALHRAVLDRVPPPAPHRAVAETSRPASAPPAGEVATTAAGPPVVPRELPADRARLVGRGAELDQLLTAGRAAAGVPAVVAISGPAGSGRSALVVRAAHLLAADFPDGQIFIDLGGHGSTPAAVTADRLVARALRALGPPPGGLPPQLDELTGWYRSRLAGRRVLVVVDDVWHADQVRPLIPAEAGSALLLTSWRRLGALDGVRRVPVGPLAVSDAEALLARLAGASRVAADPAATAELVRLCGGLPLALRIAGARLAGRPGWSVAMLAEQLTDERYRLDGLTYEGSSVRDSVARGYHAARLDDALVEPMFQLLGREPSGATAQEAAARLGVPPLRAWRSLEGLVDAHLAVGEGSGRYRLPALLRQYADELAAPQLATA